MLLDSIAPLCPSIRLSVYIPYRRIYVPPQTLPYRPPFQRAMPYRNFVVWSLWLVVGGPLMMSPTTALQQTVVLLYHKPPHVVTSHATDDPKGRLNVYQDVTSMRGYMGNPTTTTSSSSPSPPLSLQQATGLPPSRLHAVGRLDADTTGLLLLTNDGGLVHHVTNRQAKRNHTNNEVLTKTYHAVVMGHYSNDDEILQQMRQHGVDIGVKYGGQTLPVNDIHVMNHPTPKSTTVSLTIAEGKNRQIRRMFHAVGSGVMQLKRVAIGNGLTLGDLQEGQWRILSDDEVISCLSYKPRILPETKGNGKDGTFDKRRRKRRRSR